MRGRTLRGPHALLAIAVGAMVVLPIAMAGADGPEASTSASAKKQIKALKKRVAALEGTQTLPPSGPAGGDLTGDYPGPQLRADSVGPDEVALDAITKSELAGDSVGASELAGLIAVQGEGVPIAPGNNAEASVTCPPGWMVVGGGFEWATISDEASIVYSSPTFLGDPNSTWVARGRVSADGAANVLHAEASCLAV